MSDVNHGLSAAGDAERRDGGSAGNSWDRAGATLVVPKCPLQQRLNRTKSGSGRNANPEQVVAQEHLEHLRP